MSFLIYDVILLGVLVLAVAIFLYRKRKNLKKDGGAFLYKTRWGMDLIDKLGNKYKKTLKFLSYVSIGVGYILMIGMFWLFYTILKMYILRPDVVRAIKVPPVMPLIPYIDKLVPGLPPFYTTYFIIILAIIAISHEFSHGIFMRRYDIKIKSTGFGFFPFFFPVLPLAFVEQDEKSMIKKSKFKQMAVLSAGTFANVLTAVFFFFIIWGFFTASFAPAGVVFDDYSYSIVSISSITMINGVSVSNPSYDSLAELAKSSDFNNISVGADKFVGIKSFSDDEKLIVLYNDAPAINAKLNGAITKINGNRIYGVTDLSSELSGYKPGDKIILNVKLKDEVKDYELILGEHPEKPGVAWLGIGFVNQEGGSLMNKVFATLSSFKKPNTYYESRTGEFGWFVYYLLWWLILISVSVALVNMLPVGILDGGRFFYLTMIAVTGKEIWAKRSFKFLTWLFLLLLAGIMALWAYALIF